VITIVHGGQTGVDRGAHEGALDCGWQITGFMPKNGKDEQGLIPRDVAKFLEPHPTGGYKERTVANLRISAALLVMVYDAQDPYATPGTRLTLEKARVHSIPRKVADRTTDPDLLQQWLQVLLDGHVQEFQTPFRLMVAGPRASKWTTGRAETAGMLRMIHLLRCQKGLVK
jgi:hypothetical protein